ncbi:MAG TPA: cytochrome c, partial [Gammaproteobacteria bacterium]|nr:cytochrome c [Gammaproteobacteria bacterium]
EHCVKCHSSDMYTRENRIVNSYDALKERIRQCELSNDLAWFEEEVEDVSAYLDEEFYRFEEK